MEISVNNKTIPQEWVDFEQNAGLAIACLVEAFNERLALLDNNQGFSVSSSIKFVQGFTAFDYDIILYLRDGISACLGYFYDLDYDEKHLEEHKGSLKMLDLNSFDKDTVDKFINIPPRGSLIGSFKDFYGACKAILQKMTAIHFSGDVYSLKEHYNSGAYNYIIPNDYTLDQPPVDWFNIMLTATNNFTVTHIEDYGNGVDTERKVYNVFGSGNFCNHVGLAKDRDVAVASLKDIEYYMHSNNLRKEIADRTDLTRLEVAHQTNVCKILKSFVEDEASLYFDNRDVEYMKNRLSQGWKLDDAKSVIDSFDRLKECYVGNILHLPEDVKEKIDYIMEHFYRIDDSDDFVITVDGRGDYYLSYWLDEDFDYYNKNIGNYININTHYDDKESGNFVTSTFFFGGVYLYDQKAVDYGRVFRTLKRGFDSDMNYNFGTNDYSLYNESDRGNVLEGGRWGPSGNDSKVFQYSHCYGISNPLMFTACMEYLMRSHRYHAFHSVCSACFKRDSNKIIYIDNKNKSKECFVKIRYKIKAKDKYCFSEYDSYREYSRRYKTYDSEIIVTPKNLPIRLKIGWHKGAEFKWSEKINVDWLDTEAWIPSADDMKNFERGVGLCGIEGEIYIILDYKNGLKFK